MSSDSESDIDNITELETKAEAARKAMEELMETKRQVKEMKRRREEKKKRAEEEAKRAEEEEKMRAAKEKSEKVKEAEKAKKATEKGKAWDGRGAMGSDGAIADKIGKREDTNKPATCFVCKQNDRECIWSENGKNRKACATCRDKHIACKWYADSAPLTRKEKRASEGQEAEESDEDVEKGPVKKRVKSGVAGDTGSAGRAEEMQWRREILQVAKEIAAGFTQVNATLQKIVMDWEECSAKQADDDSELLHIKEEYSGWRNKEKYSTYTSEGKLGGAS